MTTTTKTFPLFNVIRWPDVGGNWWLAAELLADKGLDALNNPHAMTGRDCGCGDCFCCAAAEIVKAVKP